MAKRGLPYVESSARRGNATAQLILGFGYGAHRDDAQAAQWYRRAAPQGNPYVQESFGMLYIDGFGVSKNDSKAFIWDHRAAQHGDADAPTCSGYRTSRGVSAAKSDAKAQFALELTYASGHGLPKSRHKANAWRLKSAHSGHPLAESVAADSHYQVKGLPRNYPYALKWFTRAATLGDWPAEYELAHSYAFGQGPATDYPKAGTWRARSAGQGDSPARIFLRDVTLEASNAHTSRKWRALRSRTPSTRAHLALLTGPCRAHCPLLRI